MVNAVGGYAKRAKQPTLAGFLQDVALDRQASKTSDKESKLERNAVALMTLHAAKGLEFPRGLHGRHGRGHVAARPQRRPATGRPIDEERRLCYVGVTRAQRRLTLTLALSRQKWGKPRPTIPSRFLYEMTGQTENPNYLAAKQQKRPNKFAKPPHKAVAAARPTKKRSALPGKRPYGPP